MTHFLLQQLMGRMGTEAECGLAALYLAAEATFCTGIDLLLSGGAELRLQESDPVLTILSVLVVEICANVLVT